MKPLTKSIKLVCNEITMLSPEDSEHGTKQLDGIKAVSEGAKDWPACLRLADRLFPDNKN